MNPTRAPGLGQVSAASGTAKAALLERPAGARRSARIAVLGASGYAGQELARLALHHPGLELGALATREPAGRSLAELVPGLDPRATPLPPVTDPPGLAALAGSGAFDTLLTSLPHGAWKRLAAELPALALEPARIVDLSSDFRDGSDGYVYGLPEACRDAVAGAARLANPGCYPTAATLALLPAAEQGWLEEPVMISALSGVSGAGRAAALRTSFVELDGGAALYQAGTVHPHVAEIERNLGRLGGVSGAGLPVAVAFAPQLVPMARGILLIAQTRLAAPLSPESAHAAWRARYANEPFVRVLDPGVWPETRAVRGSNRCDLAVTTLHGGRTLMAAAALDNLVKGAAGQAIQNLNLMLGWPEEQGLPVHGRPW